MHSLDTYIHIYIVYIRTKHLEYIIMINHIMNMCSRVQVYTQIQNPYFSHSTSYALTYTYIESGFRLGFSRTDNEDRSSDDIVLLLRLQWRLMVVYVCNLWMYVCTVCKFLSTVCMYVRMYRCCCFSGDCLRMEERSGSFPR